METLILRALGAAVRNLAQLYCQKFQPSEAHKPENTTCSNSNQFCLALQQFFVVKRTCEGTEDIFSTYSSHRSSKTKAGFHHKKSNIISNSFKNCIITYFSFELSQPQTQQAVHSALQAAAPKTWR